MECYITILVSAELCVETLDLSLFGPAPKNLKRFSLELPLRSRSSANKSATHMVVCRANKPASTTIMRPTKSREAPPTPNNQSASYGKTRLQQRDGRRPRDTPPPQQITVTQLPLGTAKLSRRPNPWRRADERRRRDELAATIVLPTPPPVQPIVSGAVAPHVNKTERTILSGPQGDHAL